mmetsp:Transcript_28905/g.40283  ORF Transcript_28905/g.40283 Transcript_28905/m.40283 type:complete len:110 (+) Transcript_28905:514-843(+)
MAASKEAKLQPSLQELVALAHGDERSRAKLRKTLATQLTAAAKCMQRNRKQLKEGYRILAVMMFNDNFIAGPHFNADDEGISPQGGFKLTLKGEQALSSNLEGCEFYLP